MTTELSYLGAVTGVFLAHIFVEALLGNLEFRPAELLGARDTMPAGSARFQRAKRATRNMIEAMVAFVPLILIAHLADRTNDMTALGAAIFFWARLAYGPAYWFGVPVVRSLIWFAGLAGTILVFLQVLPFSGAN